MTYQKRPSGSAVYLKSQPGRRSPVVLSPAQIAQRAVIGARVAAWHALDQSQRAFYNSLAKSIHYVGTGYHYFMSQVLPPPVLVNHLLAETEDFLLTEASAYLILE